MIKIFTNSNFDQLFETVHGWMDDYERINYYKYKLKILQINCYYDGRQHCCVILWESQKA